MRPRTAHLRYARKTLDRFGTVALVYIRTGAPSTDPLDETPVTDTEITTSGIQARHRVQEVNGQTVVVRDRRILISKQTLDADAGTPFRPTEDDRIRIVSTGEELSVDRVENDPAESLWVLPVRAP